MAKNRKNNDNNAKKPKNKLEASRELTPDLKNCAKPGCKEDNNSR